MRTGEEIGEGNLLLGPSRGSTWGTWSGWLTLTQLVRALLVGALSGSLCFIAPDKGVGTLAEATLVPVTTGVFVTHLPPVEGIAVALSRGVKQKIRLVQIDLNLGLLDRALKNEHNSTWFIKF